ncbi:MAG TPA: WbqC family protein [Flavipsychrobacter sp.]|nr:WbqC family protein [Flavipsychrobacter sp.]
MQPSFLPWLGFFDLIRKADVFVVYDHVQFEKQSWQQRNRIRNKQGEMMLIMPVRHNNGLQRKIKDVEIDFSRNIFRKHLNSIQLSYSKAKNFDIIYPLIETIFSKKYTYLIDLNLALIGLGMEYLSINKKLLFSSEMCVKDARLKHW